ncbi:MAG: sigma-70 family RNA polymerase sigma factor [Acidimicrobiia bacterium]|nr:sigma-70 family RNA polymerase sigma factor [Acidimicrobiia bacterium]
MMDPDPTIPQAADKTARRAQSSSRRRSDSSLPPADRRRASIQHEGDPWRDWPPSPDLVEAAQSGDHQVLTFIATAAVPKLVSFYRGQGIRQHDAEDLAGDAIEAVVRTLHRLRDAGRFEAWFWRIARSKFYDHLRRKQRGAPPLTEREEMFDDPADRLLIADEHADVREAFASLKPRDRELLWMRDVVGLPYSDIAGRLKLSEGALRIGVMRARQRLEEGLDDSE